MASLKHRCLKVTLPCLVGLASVVAPAQTGRFDLLGPRIDVHVTRGDSSLPISSVPNLQPGDKLQVHADLPTTQSVHLLLVVAFLRGSTNPPPEKWFTRIETWDKKVRNEGVTVTVPPEAQQALIFVAPETGGDFSTLKSAVRGRPGIFVRASQDLNEASFEQSRIERYAQALLKVPDDSPEQLLDHSRKLAATLNLKQNDECFKRPADEQLTCLRQTGTALLLDDGHGQNLAQMLTTGPSSDLIGAVAGTPMATQAGVAGYSAYVGTVLDVVRLMTGLHTAHFQYIPAIAFPDGDALNLRLNTAPSFHDPKSVIVIALPAIQKAVPPPLQMQNARHVSCLLQPRMVLPLSGAPLVFATGFAHDLVLHLDKPAADGRVDIPLVPDAYEGGLIVASGRERKVLGTSAPPARDAAPQQPAGSTLKEDGPSSVLQTTQANQGPVRITGSVVGYWGFDRFTGPAVPLQQLPGSKWEAASHAELFTGKMNTLTLEADGTACTKSVSLSDKPDAPLDWHTDEKGPMNTIQVKLPLERTAPGKLSVEIHQFGTSAPVIVPMQAYADVARPDSVRIHAGDQFVTLIGNGLAEVKSLDLSGRTYLPSVESLRDGKSVRLAPSPAADAEKNAKSKPGKGFADGEHGTATVVLRDNRTLSVPYAVDAARPAVTLLNLTVAPLTAGLPLSMSNKAAIPLSSKITFALRSDSPSKFRRSTKVEVATEDSALTTTLTLTDGSVVLQDSHTALAFLSPEKAFGTSAFGPLQFRVLADDTASDWQSLGTLVRTPVLQQATCPMKTAGRSVVPLAPVPAAPEGTAVAAVETPCTLSGSALYLIQSASADAAGTITQDEPAGFAGDTLQVPRPVDGHTLYLRLRDDPDHLVSLQVESAERHLSRAAGAARLAAAGQ